MARNLIPVLALSEHEPIASRCVPWVEDRDDRNLGDGCCSPHLRSPRVVEGSNDTRGWLPCVRASDCLDKPAVTFILPTAAARSTRRPADGSRSPPLVESTVRAWLASEKVASGQPIGFGNPGIHRHHENR